MVPTLIVLLLISSFILIKGAGLVIVSLRRISKQTKTGVFVLSAIILALGTSLPELFVGITSAIEGHPELALGVVFGSNIANISLVAGLTAFIVGKVHVHGDFLKRDVWVALIAGILPIILVFDGQMSRIDGFILLMVYLAYVSGFFKGRVLKIAEEHKKESFFYRFMRKFNHVNGIKSKELGRLFVGIALLLFSGDMIVRLSERLAMEASIPVFVVGLVILAAGTSLPELAFSLKSLEDHEPSMFFGNLLGSTIANSTLILGVTSMIRPIKIPAPSEYLMAVGTFFVVFVSFWGFIRSKHRLDRWEAAVLLVMYIVFVVTEFV